MEFLYGPVPGNYAGTSWLNLTVWRPSTGQWWNQYTGTAPQWGVPSDVPVPADYDGDRKTDIAIWRPNTGDWWVISSATGWQVNWGVGGLGFGPTIKPVPADYDGDGKTDIATWRPSDGKWTIFTSLGNWILRTGDRPAISRCQRNNA